jgi:N-acetylglucosamine kinase-like BadF-type ATPase
LNTFLGVDGGGTKTEFLLINEDGRVLASRREGPAYYLETGVDALGAMLVAGIRATLDQASISPAGVTFAVIGLPSYGEDSALLPRLGRLAAVVIAPERYRCVNDMVCGWAGALTGHDGVNIVAGTGSIAYGEFEGRQARAGGWGELFSDEGSAYWIAREALSLFSRMSDGRADRGALYALIREHFQLHADLDVCAMVYGPPPLTRSGLAALAPIVAQAARDGDGGAQQILARAATELAAIVNAVRDQLAVPSPRALPVSYSGGMFRLGNATIPLLQSALNASGRSYEFRSPRLSPVAGAALYAAKLAGTRLSAQAVEQLALAHPAGHGDLE